jgi:hypothetical protein
MILSRLAPLVLLSLPLVAGCNVQATQGGSTGGVGDAGSDAGASCDRGAVALLTDYMSTQVALLTNQGDVQSESFLSTASTMASGDAFPLSGDVVLPHTTPASGKVVLIDQFGTNVLTWADPSSGKVLAQMSIGTGFESNPYDYLEASSTTAYVTRWGVNAAPGKMPFDAGSDVLVVDTQTRAITKSIPMPMQAGLPPRPASMTKVGDTVIVVLQPLSTDFSTYGDGVLVGLQNEAIAWQLPLKGLQNCDRPNLSPDGTTLALGCEGPIDMNGNVTDPSKTGLALYDVTTLPPKLTRTHAITDQLGSTVQSGVAWVSETMILGKTLTPLMGKTNNEAFTLDLTTGKAMVLLTAHPGSMGGKGLVYTDVRCTPGCGNVCMLADGDLGVLQRWSISGSALTPMSSVKVDPVTGLPPVLLGGY